jgi:hypothetical protein
MKKILLTALAVLATAAPLSALAAPPKTHKAKTQTADTLKLGHEEYTNGTVASYAADTRMLKLSAGEQFKVAPAITNAAYKAGDKVTVRWQMKDGARIADDIKVK